jgi:hypothetical protein
MIGKESDSLSAIVAPVRDMSELESALTALARESNTDLDAAAALKQSRD